MLSNLVQKVTFCYSPSFIQTLVSLLIKYPTLLSVQEQMLERKSVYDPYMKYVTPVKVPILRRLFELFLNFRGFCFSFTWFVLQALTYLLLLVTFWKSPVAAISKELVQPFGE